MKIRASKCIIKEISNDEMIYFLKEYHYQGPIAAKVCYGLFYNDELVELMSFGKPRYNKSYDWELLRLCTKEDYVVYGGASKLFNKFTDTFGGTVISYCNESKFTGNVYFALGFIRLGKCNSYHYEKDGHKYNRITFTKKRCIERWPQYRDIDITEAQIMSEQGFTKVDEIQATWVFGKKWLIYRTTNLVNGKTYIGQHSYTNINDGYIGSGSTFLKALKAYGKENFKREVLIDNIQSMEDADKFERCAIASERLNGKAEYNIADGGHTYDGQRIINEPWNKGLKGVQTAWNKGLKGYKIKAHSEETKRTQSESIKKAYENNPELKEKLSAAMKGNKRAKSYSQWKCVETGEIKSRKEWVALGFRPEKPTSHGKHFVNLRLT